MILTITARQSSANRTHNVRRLASQWFADKYRARQQEVGTFAAATQMRKQGVPIEVALSLLATR